MSLADAVVRLAFRFGRPVVLRKLLVKGGYDPATGQNLPDQIRDVPIAASRRVSGRTVELPGGLIQTYATAEYIPAAFLPEDADAPAPADKIVDGDRVYEIARVRTKQERGEIYEHVCDLVGA